jgi:hypothetical protein
MSEKTVTMVVCDLHAKDHPATHKVTIDVCDSGYAMLEQRMSGVKQFKCEDCGREFTVKQALGKHRHDMHGVESGRERLARERAEKLAATG